MMNTIFLFALIPLIGAQQWPCVGKCWSTKEYQSNTLWSCPACSDLPGACGYGDRVAWIQNEARCLPCDTKNVLDALHRIFAPTQPDICDDGLLLNLTGTMCAKGFYEESSLCVPCQTTEVACPRGFYPKKCINQGFGGALDQMCSLCTTPQLPNNRTRYGAGFSYKDCAADPASPCAWYQTPKWVGGYCDIECAPGFAGPSCEKCSAMCPPGFYPPTCPGPTTACIPCSAALLPEGAQWVSSCNWTCNQNGYYSPPSALSCIACPGPLSPAAFCASPKQRYLGCNGASAGECRTCNVACSIGTFLRADVYLDACTCQTCSAPKANIEFVERACTNTSNTVIAKCSKCVDGVTFAATPCQWNADTVCQPCTFVANRQMQAPCTATSDALFVSCPFSRACNGSDVNFACAAPMIAVGGVCVCPPATQLQSGGGCTPIPCPSQMYPNQDTGTCTPCGGDSDLVVSVPGIIGIDACGCKRGYLRRWPICWPCGDLGCNPILQRQAPQCDGFAADEPECKCAPGPAAISQDSSCAVDCAPGFQRVAGSSLGRYDRFGYIRMPPPTITRSTFDCPVVFGAATVGASSLLLACGDGFARVVRTDTGESATLNLSSVLEIPGWRATPRITALEQHTDAPGLPPS